MSETNLLIGPYHWLAFQVFPEYNQWLSLGQRNGLAVDYAHCGRLVILVPVQPPVTRLAPVAWLTEPAIAYGYDLRR